MISEQTQNKTFMTIQTKIISFLLLAASIVLAAKTHAQNAYHSLPASFKNTHENVLLNDSVLSKVWEKLRAGDTVKVMQIGDSHVKGKALPQAVESTLKNYFPTLKFAFYGINGAYASTFCDNAKLRAIAAEKPELVIVSFGTNEAHAPNLSTSVHTESLLRLTRGISELCPDATFLFTTPPGSFLKKAGKKYTVKRKNRRKTRRRMISVANDALTAKVARTIMTFCNDHNYAAWDLFGIGGGEQNACNNWGNSGLMNKDKIHYRVEGYTLQGTLLGEAMHKSFVGTLPAIEPAQPCPTDSVATSYLIPSKE